MKPEDQAQQQIFSEAPQTLAAGEVVIGQLCGLSPTGEALVDFSLNPSPHPLPAISTTTVDHRHLDRQVVLMFVDGRFERPLIVGFVHSPLQEMIESFELSAAQGGEIDAESDSETPLEAGQAVDDVSIDGDRVVLEAKNEIVLKCGDASITLTRAGKILIKGKYLLNRSTGVNRILGGSVQVN